MDKQLTVEMNRIFNEWHMASPAPKLVEELANLFPDTGQEDQWEIDNERMRTAITGIIVPAVVGMWLKKNEDYRGQQFSLGLRAQFIDINRKFWKLKAAIWDHKKPHFESVTEISMDMIGHLLMSLYLQDPVYWDNQVRAASRG